MQAKKTHTEGRNSNFFVNSIFQQKKPKNFFIRHSIKIKNKQTPEIIRPKISQIKEALTDSSAEKTQTPKITQNNFLFFFFLQF